MSVNANGVQEIVKGLHAGDMVEITREYNGHTAVSQGALWEDDRGALRMAYAIVRKPISGVSQFITSVRVLERAKCSWRLREGVSEHTWHCESHAGHEGNHVFSGVLSKGQTRYNLSFDSGDGKDTGKYAGFQIIAANTSGKAPVVTVRAKSGEDTFPVGTYVQMTGNNGLYRVLGHYTGETGTGLEPRRYTKVHEVGRSESDWFGIMQESLKPADHERTNGTCHACGEPMHIGASGAWFHDAPDYTHDPVKTRVEPPQGSVLKWQGKAWYRSAGLATYRVVGGPLEFNDQPSWADMCGADIIYMKPVKA